MSIKTYDTPGIMVTREVRPSGGMLGHAELAEDLARRGFDPTRYPPEIQAGLREARSRGLMGDPREAALFAVAFTDATRSLKARGSMMSPTSTTGVDRKAEADRKRLEAIGLTATRREHERLAAASRTRAMSDAHEAIGRAHFYIPEDAREAVARIMIERGLSASQAFDVYQDDDAPAPRFGGKSSSITR